MEIKPISTLSEKVTSVLKWEEGYNWSGEDEEEKKRNELLKVEKSISCTNDLSSLSLSFSDKEKIELEGNKFIHVDDLYETCVFDKEMKEVYILFLFFSYMIIKIGNISYVFIYLLVCL